MKTILMILTTLFAANLFAAPKAKIFSCVFSNPFFYAEIHGNQVWVVDEPKGKSKVFPIIEKGSEGNGWTLIVLGPDIEENLVLRFRKDGKGSDGVSDKKYAYSAKLTAGDVDPSTGGCEYD